MLRSFPRSAIALAAVIILFAVAARSHAEIKASKELLHGTWSGKCEVDEDVLRADDLFKGVPAEQADVVLKLIKDKLSKTTLTITFNADGSSTQEAKSPVPGFENRKKEGTWEVVKIAGPTITIKITPKEESDKEKATELVLTQVDDKTFTMTTMTFPAGSGTKAPKGILVRFTKK